MKKLILILLICPLILLCGFKKQQKPYAVLSISKITQQTINRTERFFFPKQKIYYAVFAPDGFKYDGIRMQLSKQDDKTANWGFTIVDSKDIYVVKGDSEYKDYVVPRTKGHYIIQFFYLNNKRYPFIHREFIVE